MQPTNKNELIVWDLAHDPAELPRLGVADLRLRMFSRSDELPEGVQRLPIKTIHINKSPVVIANLKTLSPAMAARWGLDIDQGLRHADAAARHARLLAGMWPEVFQRPAPARLPDVDEDLYGGFLGNEDRRTLQRLRALDSQALAGKRPAFADSRLDELLFRYRARNFPETLSEAEQAQWQEHCHARLCHAAGGALDLAVFEKRIAALQAAADARGTAILQALRAYAAQIAPACA
jgi:exodeoxyribonuclease-1